jgi:LmbE family N-acetylglucosaminyl deacetylase
MAPTLLHVSPHPDDEAVGCPAALLHFHDRGWRVVNLVVSLGFPAQQSRRRAETAEATARAGFVAHVLDPPLPIAISDDLEASVARLAGELPALVGQYDASVVVSPSPHDVHHGHEVVGRAVQRAMAELPDSTRWWMWGVWGDLPAPNIYYGFDQSVLDRALHILEAYAGELERNDYRGLLTGRAMANTVLGAERVFGFGYPSASTKPYAEVLTEVRRLGGRFMASEPHHLDEGPSPTTQFDLDLTPWIEAPSMHEMVGRIREVDPPDADTGADHADAHV